MRNAAGSGTIRKKTVTRNGKTYTYWEARYTVGRNPTTGAQVQRSVTGKTQKEVKLKLTQATAAIDAGTYTEPSKLLLSQWLEIWTGKYLLKQKPLTVKAYQSAVRNHIVPGLGGIRLDHLNANQIQDWIHGLYGSLSPKTVKDTYGVLHKALTQAVDSGLLPRNPSDGCVIAQPPRPEIRTLEPLEIYAFLQAAAADEYHNLFTIAAATGMRQGELLGLSWADVDFRRGSIRIRHQLQRVGKEYVLGTPKSGQERTIVPAPLVMDALASEKARQQENAAAWADIWQNQFDLVFTTVIGDNLVARTVDKHFKKILAAAGLPDMRFHDLRHTFAVNSLMAGDDIKTLQGNLGHATPQFTLEVYAHYTDQMRHDSGNRMQQFFENISEKGKLSENEKSKTSLKVI